ncbi:MAG: RcnB family protein [Rhodospirillales bacterium]
MLRGLLACALAVGLAAGTAWADKPPGGGPPHGKGHGKPAAHGRHDEPRRDVRFRDNDRVVIHNYYGPIVSAGRCPPGLARKGTGCLPPGQAKKWAVGRPLPREVIYYALPQALVVQLGPPPPHHRYVRVAGDILMIAIGTGMVVDAIIDLGRM